MVAEEEMAMEFSPRSAVAACVLRGPTLVTLFVGIQLAGAGSAIQARAQVPIPRTGTDSTSRGVTTARLDSLLGANTTDRFVPWRIDGNQEVVGATFGSSWGDMDADGDPDLFLNKHYSGMLPLLLRNDGGGMFTDISSEVLDDPTLYRGDRHAGTWTDVDADGELDLVVTYGANYGLGGAPNRVFRFESGIAADLAAWYGLDSPLARARALHPLDWNGDGMIDYFMSAMPRPDGRAPRTLFLNSGPSHDPAFVDCEAALQLPVGSSYFTQTVPLPDGTIGFWMHGFPPQMLRVGAFPADDRTAALGLSGLSSMTDSAFADFDGDGDFDLFCATARERSGAELDSNGRVEACVIALQNELGVDVAPQIAGTPVTFELRGNATPNAIFIGASGNQPAYATFTVDPNDTTTHGLFPHAAGSDRGIYVGYDASRALWQLRASSDVFFRVTVVAHATSGMLPPTAVGFDPNAAGVLDRLFLWEGGRFVQAGAPAGFVDRTDAMSCAAADFDNDGDVDLYLVCTGPVSNRPNRYYRNHGDGTFLLVSGAEGAAGSDAGRGDTVTTADFDGDGTLDLCVTNGEGDAPFFRDGPIELFRGTPNGNHWLMLDLRSAITSPDAWGTRISARVGGRTFERWQDGGVHRFSQDDRRIHIGLGAATRVDLLRITWPNGQVDDHVHVPVDQVLTLVQR